MRRARRRRLGVRADSGSVLVEFSLVLPVLIILVLGVTEVCRALIAYRKLTQLTESLAWTTQALVVSATSTTNVSLPIGGSTVLGNILFVMQGETAPSNLFVSVRYLTKSMISGLLSETTLYKTQTAPASNNNGIDTNMMSGDTRIVVQSAYTYQPIFGVLGLSFALSSRYSI